MVQSLTHEYNKPQTLELEEYFNKFNFELSPFQKFAIEAIVSGNHSLSCVPTGSGKTLPALFAIDFFTSQSPKKKVIYTSPIKALSNQKYYEFTQKFPHLSIGLLTGDIKINPEADVLIMTAEILQNTLYKKTQQKENNNNETQNPDSLLMFDMDFDNELACVIQDEVHMINDSDRGHVWENTILMLPTHIQMVMLSATLDNPIKFAEWIECRGNLNNIDTQKQVYLATSTFRPVPLTHYSFIASPQAIYKAIKDKTIQEKIRKTVNTLHTIQSPTGTFDEEKYHHVKGVIDLIQTNKVFVKRTFILNEVCKYLVEHNMLPAVCFILSKKQIQIAAKEVSIPLLEDDSKVPYLVKRECEQLLRTKLPNYEEYLHLPEYIEMVSLLEKGIAIHHSGVMPILREIVELMFEKGYIKLLFATETFSVGLNMPIKTVIFTDVKKFDGSGMRMLLPHEYTQAAGRAGRRGIDKVGSVIHLPNLFRNVSLTEYRTMMQGKSQTLVSKFKFSYNLIFNIVDTQSTRTLNDETCINFCRKSMIQHELSGQLSATNVELTSVKDSLTKTKEYIQNIRTPMDAIERYMELTESIPKSKNKARKQLERELTNIKDAHKNLPADLQTVQSMKNKEHNIIHLENQYNATEKYIENQVNIIISKFIQEEYIIHNTENGELTLTNKALYAANIRETPCMVFAELLTNDVFEQLQSHELTALFSCFTGINVSDELKEERPTYAKKQLKDIIDFTTNITNKYIDFETSHHIDTGTDYEIRFDIMKFVSQWFNAKNIEECKLVLQQLQEEKGIFVGEFVKAIIKITNIASEIERVAEFVGNLSLVQKMRDIPKNILKYVATNQSLYI
jgi:superfamily II RNA helicase